MATNGPNFHPKKKPETKLLHNFYMPNSIGLKNIKGKNQSKEYVNPKMTSILI
jgi:hypothetical protein